MRLFISLVLFLFVTTSYAQDVRVIVPEQFDFIEGKDTYQLNSITNFLLNKKGVNASFAKDAGSYSSCEVAYADVIKLKAFLATKLQLQIKTCSGIVLYKSPEGYSKNKDFRQAYQGALRDIFSKIEVGGMDIKLPSMVNAPNINTTAPVNKEIDKVTTTFKIPQSKFTSYQRGENAFMLKKSPSGFSFYQENTETGNLEIIGTIELDAEGVFYLTNNAGNLVRGYFDADSNLHLTEMGEDKKYKVVTQ